MFEKFIGLVMIGLGILQPASGQVAGDNTDTEQSTGGSSSAGISEDDKITGTSGINVETSDDNQKFSGTPGRRDSTSRGGPGASGKEGSEKRKLDEKNRMEAVRATGEQNRELLKTKREDIREQMKKDREASREAFLSHVEDIKQTAKEHLEELKTLEAARQEKFHEQIKQMREEHKTQREDIHQTFLANLDKIKDSASRSAVKRIDDNMQKVTTNQTDRMKSILDKLGSKLDDITARAAAAKTAGTNTTQVDGAIAQARATITTAQSAVSDFAAKTHAITLTDPDHPGGDVSAAFQALKADVETVRKSVKDAYEAVRAALKALGMAIGESESGSPSPTP